MTATAKTGDTISVLYTGRIGDPAFLPTMGGGRMPQDQGLFRRNHRHNPKLDIIDLHGIAQTGRRTGWWDGITIEDRVDAQKRLTEQLSVSRLFCIAGVSGPGVAAALPAKGTPRRVF